MTKKLFLVAGKPGSGKSTVSRLAAAQLGEAYHFSMGDEIRARALHGKPSRFSEQLKTCVDAIKAALPIPHELVTGMFEECIADSPTDTIIVDGYPQYPDRLPAFDETNARVDAEVQAVCIIDVSDSVARTRLLNREGRFADVAEDEAYVAKRLAGFTKNVVPTIEVLAKQYHVHHIDGSAKPEAVAAALVAIIQNVRA
jgi:adenylate kinase family enzyme